MSDGDRSKRVTHLEALFCILALLGIVSIIYATGRSLGVETGRNEVTAREHYEREKEGALQACINIVGKDAVQCATKAIESAQEKSETRQDLYAQQDAAKWGFWAMTIAACSALVTAIGTALLYQQIVLTRKAVDDTDKATEAMQKANRIATEVQRPWLSAEAGFATKLTPGTTHLGADGFYIDVAGTITNHGDTPATDVKVNVKIVILRGDGDLDQMLSDCCDQWRDNTVSGGPALYMGKIRTFTHTLFIPQSEIDDALNCLGDFKFLSLMVFVCITYRAAQFKTARQTRIRYYTCANEAGKAMLIQTDKPNWWQCDIRFLDHETVFID